MSKRIDAAGDALYDLLFDYGLSQTNSNNAASVAIEASDAVMFSDEAVERAARIMFPTYWDPEFYHEHSEATGNVIEESQRGCIDHIRIIIAALKEDA